MRKYIKKNFKKMFSMMMIFALLLNYVMPITNVLATAGDVMVQLDNATIDGTTITFTVDETPIPVTINAINNATYTIENNIISITEANKYNVKFQLPENFDRSKYEVYAFTTEASEVTLTGDNDFSAGAYSDLVHIGIRVREGYNNNSNNNPDPNQNNNNNNNNQQPPEPFQNFDGKAYLIWSCKSGGVCYKYIEGIPGFDDGRSTFYPASNFVDERTGEAFDVNAEYKGWSTPDKFDQWVNNYKLYNDINGSIDWSHVNPKDMIGDPLDMGQYEDAALNHGCTKNEPEDVFRDCVDNYVLTNKIAFPSRAQLQPVGEPQYKNAYVSYGDRNFKVVVYNNNYKGVSYGDLSDLKYYPSAWANAYLMRDQFDISGTTKDKPAKLDAILLESTLNIEALDPNGFEITELVALDVPKDAVSITKVDGKWRIEFSSNYYDQVVFKAKDNNGEESYFQIKRYTIDGWIRHDNNNAILTADFFYDNNPTLGYTHESFTLTAKILFKDGTTKNVTLDPVKRIDDGMGNITKEYEMDEAHPTYGPAGKGLMRSVYEYTLATGDEDNIKDIYLNAEFTGSTKTHYAGAFSGSGKGILANIYHGEGE